MFPGGSERIRTEGPSPYLKCYFEIIKNTFVFQNVFPGGSERIRTEGPSPYLKCYFEIIKNTFVFQNVFPGGSERIYNPQRSLQKQNKRASSLLLFLAEARGFEPPRAVKPHTISSRAPSTTRPRFRLLFYHRSYHRTTRRTEK